MSSTTLGSNLAAGLAAWHVDELGSNSNEQMAPLRHYECALVQADGKNDLEQKVNYGDAGDLFAAGENDTLTDTTNASARWRSGQDSGLKLTHISAAGATVTFRVAS